MKKLWKTYKPFIGTGMQELSTYRVNFFLYRIGDIIGVFIVFYLWKAIFNSSHQSVIQGFSLSDMTFYIIMNFITNLLINSDSSFMIGEEVRDGSIIMRLLRPIHFIASYLFTEIGSKVVIFFSVALPFLVIMMGLKIIIGYSALQTVIMLLAYLLSVSLAFLINFFFNTCFGFSTFIFKNLWGTNLLKNSLIAFMSGSLIPLTFFPKTIKWILTFLPFSSLNYTPVMIVIGKYNGHQVIQMLLLQLFWLFVIFSFSQLIWKHVQCHITIQGG